MSDDAVREVYRRVAAILSCDGMLDYYYACVVVSDLGSEPFERVWALCIDE